MQVTATEYENCDVVKVVGRVDSGTASGLAEKLDLITKAGRFKIVLDLSEVDFMSSAGLRILISTQKACKRYNRGELILAEVPRRIYDAMDLAGFVPLFKFDDTVQDAISNF